MRTITKGMLAASAFALVAGCSAVPTQPVVDPAYELDLQRMAVIEHVAAQRGVRVIWVNAPKKLASL